MLVPVRLLLAGALVAALAGCAPGDMEPVASATHALLPFPTATLTMAVGTPTNTVEPIPTGGPSPTPQAYTVRANDTFLGIALAFGLTREELEAANPGLNPNLLSIGQLILIPPAGAQGGTATPIPTPTPIPLETGKPRCYLTTNGGAWCLLTVHNTTEGSVEGLSGWVTLLDAHGKALLTILVYPPLNLLLAGQTTVLAGFQLTVPEFVGVASAVTMAVPVQDAAARYPALDWSVVDSQPADDRKSWTASVEVGLPADVKGEPRVSLALLAFDRQGEAAGFAKWEPEAPLVPGQRTRVRLSVYSLGPPIDRVEVMAEALAVP